MSTGAEEISSGEYEGRVFADVFAKLTPKQHEVMLLIANNHTSKEIAWRLGISESAVNQRIECIRAKAAFPARAELARAYRQHRYGGGVEQADSHRMSPATSAGVLEPDRVWQQIDGDRVGPSSLDGPDGPLNRALAMIAVAGGLLMVALIGLSLAQALSAVFGPTV